MNIEESIKEMKSLSPSEKAIETLLTAYEKEKGENVKLRLQDIPLIEGELKAYKDRVNELKQELEKEKEKNKELKEKEKNLLIQLKDSEKELLEVCEKLRNSVGKDKIKAKIEELSNGTYDAKIVLQSLLEKE